MAKWKINVVQNIASGSFSNPNLLKIFLSITELKVVADEKRGSLE
jgi:hypothetical protein